MGYGQIYFTSGSYRYHWVVPVGTSGRAIWRCICTAGECIRTSVHVRVLSRTSAELNGRHSTQPTQSCAIVRAPSQLRAAQLYKLGEGLEREDSLSPVHARAGHDVVIRVRRTACFNLQIVIAATL